MVQLASRLIGSMPSTDTRAKVLEGAFGRLLDADEKVGPPAAAPAASRDRLGTQMGRIPRAGAQRHAWGHRCCAALVTK